MAKPKPKPVPPCRPVKGRPAKVIATNRLSARQRQSCANAAAELMRGFNWDESAESEDFWNAVYDRLFEIANGAPLK